MISIRIRTYYKDLLRFCTTKEYEMNKNISEIEYVMDNYLCLAKRDWPGDSDIVRIIIPTYFYNRAVEKLRGVFLVQDTDHRQQYFYRSDMRMWIKETDKILG